MVLHSFAEVAEEGHDKPADTKDAQTETESEEENDKANLVVVSVCYSFGSGIGLYSFGVVQGRCIRGEVMLNVFA